MKIPQRRQPVHDDLRVFGLERTLYEVLYPTGQLGEVQALNEVVVEQPDVDGPEKKAGEERSIVGQVAEAAVDQLGRELTSEHTSAGLGATVEGNVGKLIDTGWLQFVPKMDEKRIRKITCTPSPCLPVVS